MREVQSDTVSHFAGQAIVSYKPTNLLYNVELAALLTVPIPTAVELRCNEAV